MEIIRNFKKGITQWLWIIFILLLSWISYAAWTTLSTETDWATITVDKWNAIINRLNSIDQKSLATAWVNFDWTNCSWWAWVNECTIKDSYNISKVIRMSVGQYDIYFTNSMTNNNYVVNIWQLTPGSWVSWESYKNRLTNKVSVWTINYTSWVDIEASVTIFWWK